MRPDRTLAVGCALAVFVLAAVVSCQGPRVRLPVQEPDVDDTDDELVPCNDAGLCADLEQPLCHPLGYCVECINDDDCARGFTCDLEGECERI